MKRIIITLICIISLFNAFATNNREDNSDNELLVSETQYEKLIDLAKTYFTENTEYAFVCLYKAYVIAEESAGEKNCWKLPRNPRVSARSGGNGSIRRWCWKIV